jgi:hypothetical protein
VGVVSIDGNLFINADTTTGATNPLLSMSVKSSNGKTNADLSGTYVLHQFVDDATGTYTETAKSNSGSGTNPSRPNPVF